MALWIGKGTELSLLPYGYLAFLFFFKIYLLFVYERSARMHHTQAWSLWRLEKGFRPPIKLGLQTLCTPLCGH